MIDAFIGTKPYLYLAILATFLFIRYICIPLIEWAIDRGERMQARDVYHQRARDERRKFDAIVAAADADRRRL